MTDLSSPDLTVIYDGDCGVCSRIVLWAMQQDDADRLHFVPYQTADFDAIAPGLTREQAAESVYIARPDGTRQHGARAIFEMLRRLPGIWRVVGRIGALPPVSLFAEPVYRLVARHRGQLSKIFGLTQCRVTPSRASSEPGEAERGA